MGKCLRRSCRQEQQTAAVEAAAYLTLRSGRRVPAACAAGSPRRRQRRRGGRCCGKAKAGAAAAARQRHRRVVASQGRREEKEVAELPLPTSLESPVVFRDERCGGDRHVTPVSGEGKRDHENDGGVAGRSPSSPTPEAEIEAFFAAAELAERRRFAETYNYDVAFDRPLADGRFEWSPVSTSSNGTGRPGVKLSIHRP